MHGLGDAERAAIGDAAGRLVGVDAVDLDVRVGHVVRAGADRKQAGRELGRIGRGIGRAVVGEGLDAQRRHLAVLVGGQLGVHVVVAREGVGLQVLGAVLDPLDRATRGQGGDDGAHVARIDRHLAAEAAADIRRDDADLVLGDLRHQREHGANGVRRLGGHPHRQLAADAVEAGDAAARLDRGDVDARDVDVLGDDDL